MCPFVTTRKACSALGLSFKKPTFSTWGINIKLYRGKSRATSATNDPRVMEKCTRSVDLKQLPTFRVTGVQLGDGRWAMDDGRPQQPKNRNNSEDVGGVGVGVGVV